MINPIELENDELYFADESYMSVSRYKKFKRCELGGIEPWGKPSDAMLIGSYVDDYISGILDKFKLDHPEIISTRGATKGELKADFKKADEICKFIDNDIVFSQFLSGEKQSVMTGEINGIPFKCKMDSYSKGMAISDLKVVRTVTDSKGNYIDFVTSWNYDTQLACYQEICFQNTGERLPCYICAVTKESPINSVIIEVPQVYLDMALYDVECNIERYYGIKMGTVEAEGCGTCKTCIEARTETPIISLQDIIEGVM
jgi:hypothetical protein